ncbi:MAG: hypothetical protein WBN11_10770, partial [Eudoraea sp.]
MKQFLLLLSVFIFISGCKKEDKKNELNTQTDISTLEKEIESRLREYENHLRNEDSVALGNMYMKDAEIIPSTVGKEN